MSHWFCHVATTLFSHWKEKKFAKSSSFPILIKMCCVEKHKNTYRWSISNNWNCVTCVKNALQFDWNRWTELSIRYFQMIWICCDRIRDDILCIILSIHALSYALYTQNIRNFTSISGLSDSPKCTVGDRNETYDTIRHS